MPPMNNTKLMAPSIINPNSFPDAGGCDLGGITTTGGSVGTTTGGAVGTGVLVGLTTSVWQRREYVPVAPAVPQELTAVTSHL